MVGSPIPKPRRSAFELTMMGYIRAIRACLPHMKKGGGGRIVNNTSVSTKQAIDSLVLSNVFRAGLVGLGKSLARELGPERILVNTVGPGRIDTERVEQLDNIWAGQKGITYEEQRKQSEQGIPLGAYGQPNDFGKVVAFLCSESNAYLTGQNILIDGAMPVELWISEWSAIYGHDWGEHQIIRPNVSYSCNCCHK